MTCREGPRKELDQCSGTVVWLWLHPIRAEFFTETSNMADGFFNIWMSKWCTLFFLKHCSAAISWPIKGLSVNPRLICANDLTLNSSSTRSPFPLCCLFSKVLTRSLPFSPSCDLRFYFLSRPIRLFRVLRRDRVRWWWWHRTGH